MLGLLSSIKARSQVPKIFPQAQVLGAPQVDPTPSGAAWWVRRQRALQGPTANPPSVIPPTGVAPPQAASPAGSSREISSRVSTCLVTHGDTCLGHGGRIWEQEGLGAQDPLRAHTSVQACRSSALPDLFLLGPSPTSHQIQGAGQTLLGSWSSSPFTPPHPTPIQGPRSPFPPSSQRAICRTDAVLTALFQSASSTNGTQNKSKARPGPPRPHAAGPAYLSPPHTHIH